MINLNDYVWAELNENGWKSLEHYYEKLFSGVYPFGNPNYSASEYVELYKKETAPHVINGVERMLTRFLLHDFIAKFGAKINVAAENVVVNNNLYFADNFENV